MMIVLLMGAEDETRDVVNVASSAQADDEATASTCDERCSELSLTTSVSGKKEIVTVAGFDFIQVVQVFTS